MQQILDSGYVKLIETWGSDERIIEAARMSTNKGFKGWGGQCPTCHGEKVTPGCIGNVTCSTCRGVGSLPTGDEKLLAYLYNNKHSTPFEMAGMVIEVKAPIFIFREWHRHRTQSYNEMSARYIPLPDENYRPDIDNLLGRANADTGNKQAQGSGKSLDRVAAGHWLGQLDELYNLAQKVYENGIDAGVPKELARLPVPVSRYSRMRASANLRNWLSFLTLRMAPNAQWEIQQYANAVGCLVAEAFPRTWELFSQEKQ